MSTIGFSEKIEELFGMAVEAGRKAIQALGVEAEAERKLRDADKEEKDAGHELSACDPDEYREYSREHAHASQQATHARREFEKLSEDARWQLDEFNELVHDLEETLKTHAGSIELYAGAHRDLVAASFACYQPDPEGPHGWKRLEERIEIYVKFISDLSDKPTRDYRQQLVVSARNLGINPEGRNNEELSRIIDQYMWADMAAFDGAQSS